MIYIDTIQKRFIFKYVCMNNQVTIDSLKKEIINVELLKIVDISNLVGGIKNGHGINVDEISNSISSSTYIVESLPSNMRTTTSLLLLSTIKLKGKKIRMAIFEIRSVCFGTGCDFLLSVVL